MHTLWASDGVAQHEVFMQVTLLRDFSDMVLAPAGILPRRARCMTLLYQFQKVLLGSN